MENEELKETVSIPFKSKTLVLNMSFLDLNINVDELTKINYSNLYGEMITIPTLTNKVGIIRAEAEYNMSMSKLDRNIKAAELNEYYRKKLSYEHVNYKKETVWKAPNNDTVTAAIDRDIEYINICKRYIRMTKNFNNIDSLFWSVKDKAGILKKMGESMKLTPEDFEKNIVEGAINGMMIKMHENLIK